MSSAVSQGEFVKGLRRFGYGLSATTQAFAGQMAEPFAPEFAKRQFDEAAGTLRSMPQSVRPAVETFDGVKDLRTAGQYVAGALGEGLPSTAVMLGAGLAGRGVAALAGASPAARLAAQYGSGAAAMTPMEGGETALQIQQDPQALANTTPAERAALTLGRGTVNAALENIVPQALIAPRLLGQAARVAPGLGNAARTVGLVGAAGATGEYGTEVAQDITGQMALKQARGDQQGNYDWAQANEAGIKGAITGAVTGGVAGGAQALYSNIGAGADAAKQRIADASPADRFVSTLRQMTENPQQFGADAANMTLDAIAKAASATSSAAKQAGPTAANGLDTAVDAVGALKRQLDSYIINNVSPENRDAYMEMSSRLGSMTAPEYKAFTSALRAETGKQFQYFIGASAKGTFNATKRGVRKGWDWTTDVFKGASQAVSERTGTKQSLDTGGYTDADRKQMIERAVDVAPRLGWHYSALSSKGQRDLANFLLAARDNPSYFEAVVGDNPSVKDPVRQRALQDWRNDTGTELTDVLKFIRQYYDDNNLSPSDKLKLREQAFGLADNRGTNTDRTFSAAELYDSPNRKKLSDELEGETSLNTGVARDELGNQLDEESRITNPWNRDAFRQSMYPVNLKNEEQIEDYGIPVEFSSDQLTPRQIAAIFGKRVEVNNGGEWSPTYADFSERELNSIPEDAASYRTMLNSKSLASVLGTEGTRERFAPFMPERPENASEDPLFSEDRFATEKMLSALAALQSEGIQVDPETVGLPAGDPITIKANVDLKRLKNNLVVRGDKKKKNAFTIGDYTGATKRERGVAAQARLLESFKGNFRNANDTLFKMQATNQTAEAINREAYKRAARIYETNTGKTFKDLPKAQKTARINDQIALYAEEVTEKARKQAERRANSEYTRSTVDFLRAAYREGELTDADVNAIRASIEAGDVYARDEINRVDARKRYDFWEYNQKTAKWSKVVDSVARDEIIEPTEEQRERSESVPLKTEQLPSLADLLYSLDMPLPATYTAYDNKALLTRLEDMLLSEDASRDRSDAIATGRVAENPREEAGAAFKADMQTPEQRANTLRKATLRRAEERDPEGAAKGQQTAKLVRETQPTSSTMRDAAVLEEAMLGAINNAKTTIRLNEVGKRIAARAAELTEGQKQRLREAFAAKKKELATPAQVAAERAPTDLFADFTPMRTVQPAQKTKSAARRKRRKPFVPFVGERYVRSLKTGETTRLTELSDEQIDEAIQKYGSEKQSRDTGAKQSNDAQMSPGEIIAGLTAAVAERRYDTKLMEAAIKAGIVPQEELNDAKKLLQEIRDIKFGKNNKGGLAQKTVDAWSRKFADGKPVTVVAIDANSIIASVVSESNGFDVSALGGVAMQIDDGYYIVTVKGGTQAKSTALSRLAHEFGHILQKIAFNNAPQETKKKLIAAHKRDVAAFNKNPALISKLVSAARFVDNNMASELEAFIEEKGEKLATKIMRENMATMLFPAIGEKIAKGDATNRDYILSFDEWFAEQFSKYVTSNGKTLDPELQSMWDKLIENIKRFFNAVIKPLKPNAAFKDWVESLVRTEGPVEELESVISATIDKADSVKKLNAVGLRIAARSGELSKEATERLREKYKAKKEALQNKTAGGKPPNPPNPPKPPNQQQSPPPPPPPPDEVKEKFIKAVEKLVGKRVRVMFDQKLADGVAGEYTSREDFLEKIRNRRRWALEELKIPFADREPIGNRPPTDQQLQKVIADANAKEQEVLADKAMLGVLRIAAGMEQRAGLAEHESFHGAFSFFFNANNGEERRVLTTAFSNGIVNRRLREYFKDNDAVLAKIDPNSKSFDPEEAAAYGFQVWMMDPSALQLGERVQNIFERVKKFFRDLFGMMTVEERAQLILNDLATGRRAERGTSPLAKQLDKDRPWTERAQIMAKDVGGLIKSGYDMLLSPVYDRLLDFENPAIAQIAKLGYQATGEDGKGGYIQNVRLEARRQQNRLNNIFKGLTDEQMKELHNAKIADVRPTDKVLGERFDALTQWYKDMYNYQVLAGTGIKNAGINENYYPLLWDAEKVLKDKDAFLKMLQKPEYADRMDELMMTPNEIWESITAYIERGEDLASVVGRNNEPISESSRKRTLGFITRDDRRPFMTDDLVHTSMRYMQQAVRQAEFVRAYGQNGETLRALRNEAQSRYGATNDQMALVDDYIDGLLGNKEVGMSRELKDLYGALTVYQNYRLLPFSLFSSLVDPIGIAVRSNSIGDAWDTFSYSIKNVFNELKKDYTPDQWEVIAQDWGIIEASGTTINADALYTGVTLRGTTKKLNDAFFKYNLLNGWIRNNHIMAVRAAQQFMYRASEGFFKGEGQNERYLEELGVTKDDIIYDQNLGRILMRAEELEAVGKSRAEAAEIEERLRRGTEKFVRQALLNPNSAELANWASNPYLAPISHLKQFVWAFNSTIIKRLEHEAENQNFTPVLLAAAYVPGMIAADLVKDFISNAGEEPPYKKDWTVVDYVQHGIMRSGLTGTGQFFVDVQEDMARGGAGYESFAGPSLEQLQKGVEALSQGDTAKMERWFVKALPANAAYDQWLPQ